MKKYDTLELPTMESIYKLPPPNSVSLTIPGQAPDIEKILVQALSGERVSFVEAYDSSDVEIDDDTIPFNFRVVDPTLLNFSAPKEDAGASSPTQGGEAATKPSSDVIAASAVSGDQ